MKQSNDEKNQTILLDKVFDLIKEHTNNPNDGFDFAVQFFAIFCISISKEGRGMAVFDEAVRQARVYLEAFQSLTEDRDMQQFLSRYMFDDIKEDVTN